MTLTVTFEGRSVQITPPGSRELTVSRKVIAASATAAAIPPVVKIGFDPELAQLVIEGVGMFPPQSLTVLRFGTRISVWQVQVNRVVLSRIEFHRLTRFNGSLFASAKEAETYLTDEFEKSHPDYLASIKDILQ